MLELSDSFEQDDEQMEDDIDYAFESFELGFGSLGQANSRSKNDGGGTYNSATGYWERTIDKEFSRMDSMYRNDELIVRNKSIDIDKESKARFEDLEGNPIEDVKSNRENIVKVLMERSGTLDLTGTVSIYDINGALTKELSKTLMKDEKSNNATLTKLEEDGLWSLVGESEKDINLTIETPDSSKTIDRTVHTLIDVVVKKGEKKKGRFGKKRRGKFVSGTVTRTINDGDKEIIIITTYFDPETDSEGRLFTRTITENGELVDESTVYPGEEGQRKHHKRGSKKGKRGE